MTMGNNQGRRKSPKAENANCIFMGKKNGKTVTRSIAEWEKLGWPTGSLSVAQLVNLKQKMIGKQEEIKNKKG